MTTLDYELIADIDSFVGFFNSAFNEKPAFIDTSLLTPVLPSQIFKNGKRVVTWDYLKEIRKNKRLLELSLEENSLEMEIVLGSVDKTHDEVYSFIDKAYSHLAHLVSESKNLFITEEVKEEYSRHIDSIEEAIGKVESPRSKEFFSLMLKQAFKINNAIFEAEKDHRVIIDIDSRDSDLQKLLEDVGKEKATGVSNADVALIRRAIIRAADYGTSHLIYSNDRRLHEMINSLDKIKNKLRDIVPYDFDDRYLIKSYWVGWSFDSNSYRRFSVRGKNRIKVPSLELAAARY